jgi:hypothetical protein
MANNRSSSGNLTMVCYPINSSRIPLWATTSQSSPSSRTTSYRTIRSSPQLAKSCLTRRMPQVRSSPIEWSISTSLQVVKPTLRLVQAFNKQMLWASKARSEKPRKFLPS